MRDKVLSVDVGTTGHRSDDKLSVDEYGGELSISAEQERRAPEIFRT